MASSNTQVYMFSAVPPRGIVGCWQCAALGGCPPSQWWPPSAAQQRLPAALPLLPPLCALGCLQGGRSGDGELQQEV